eukprot:COSAG02_NODE_16796_length_1055_cov_1.063808_1_plen_37_part_10
MRVLARGAGARRAGRLRARAYGYRRANRENERLRAAS